MTDSLRLVRVVAGWVIVVYVGLFVLSMLIDWLALAADGDAAEAVLRTYGTGGMVLFLPAVAVLVSGVASPTSPGARPIAMIAFIEYGALLLWSVIYAAVYCLRLLTAPPEPYGYPMMTPTSFTYLVIVGGAVALTAVGAFFAWRVYVGTDLLAHDIDDLADRIALLDAEDDVSLTPDDLGR